MMKHITKILAIVLILTMLFQLVACSGSQGSTGTEAVASDTSVSGTTVPKISVSTISPNTDGEGFETHTETYNLDDAVGIQPIDFDNLYVIADSLNWKQDLNAFTVQEISVVYYEPALIEDFLISQQSFEEFFGWSTSDLQEFGNTALTFSSEGEVNEAITITPVKSTSTPYDYKSFFGKLAAGCGILLIGATLSVATGGTFTCALMAVSRAALSGAVISGAVVSTYETCKGMSKGQSVTEAFINSADSSLDAFADGFVIGAIIGGIYSVTHPVCFVAGTPIATPYGTVPIEDLCPGDTVLTKNMRTGVVEPQPILNTFTNEAQEMVHITVDYETISTTREHPFYSPTHNGWIAACQLRAGDYLVSVNGQLVVVEQIQHESLSEPVPVYNIEVANNNNYFSGNNASVLVHNRCNINSQYAGNTKYFEEGTAMAQKYPDGVTFDVDGYARFEPYAKVKITFENGTLNGNYTHDFKLANDYIGLGNKVSATPAGYTWHHVEDGKTLLLVPQDIHSAVRHTGGASILRGSGG